MSNELPKQSEGIETSVQQVARVLLEILILGEESNKQKIHQFMQDIQEQIKNAKQSRRVRLLFYIDKGEKTDEEKIEWLINNSECKYYLIANPKDEQFKGHIVPKDYIKNCMKNIKLFEESFSKMKQLGITIKRNK
jgi:hypothetical protein